jgi:cytochrome P450
MRAEGRLTAVDEKNSATKSIISLAISGLKPTPTLIRNTVAQVKTFLFAGQDTTATLIQWLCYEISKSSFKKSHADMLAKLTAEHDAVFGKTSNPFNALDILDRQDEQGRKEAESILGNKLPYTTAFLKETLRCHAPAGSARLVPEISTDNPVPFNVPITTKSASSASGVLETKEININGLIIDVCAHLIHRNPTVWGEDAHEFRPDRWLDDEYMSKLPPGAFRPFERGPRACIGQELAMLEAKIVLCAVARGFEWEKIGYTGKKEGMGTPKGDGTDDVERELWNIMQVTSVAVDGMKMKVKLR